MAKDFVSGLTGPFKIVANNQTNSAMVQSAANTAGDKKVLIVFYLEGGVDCHNFLSPANTASNNRINYMSARSSLSVPIDKTKQTLLTPEWQLHPRLAGMQHVSSSSIIIPVSTVSGEGAVYTDSTIAIQGSYNRDNTSGVITATWTGHGLSNGDFIYADFAFYGNTSPQNIANVVYPTDGRYPITQLSTDTFNFTPTPLVTNSTNPGFEQGLFNQLFKVLAEKRTVIGAINAGDATVILNIAPLVNPVYRNRIIGGNAINDYPNNSYNPVNTSKKLPIQLSSHSDQKAEWFSARPDSPASGTGWVGRMMDMINPSFNANTNLPSAYTLNGPNLTLYSSVPNNLDLLPTGLNNRSSIDGSNLVGFDSKVLNSFNYTNPMMLEYIQAQRRSNTNTISINTIFNSNAPSTSFSFIATNNSNRYRPLENLNCVSRMIKGMFNNTSTAAGTVSQRRQVFFFNLNNFDQHDGLISDLDANLVNTSKTIVKFLETVNEDPNIANNTLMLVFTEFGRSLAGNADGSDHAWGGHAMLVGKPVNGFGKSKTIGATTYTGSKYYGSFPDLSYGYGNIPQDITPGVTALIPTMTSDTIYATIAQWFGVPDAWYDATGNTYTSANAAIANASSPGSVVNPMEILLPNLPNFTPNTAQGIFAPLWARDPGDTHRLIAGLLKDSTFNQ